jgi:cell division protein ZapC
MPKSWHFSQQHYPLQPKNGELAAVKVMESGVEARLLVVEAGDNASLCLLAQNQLSVAGRTMVLGDAIKVMHDRLKPCAQDETSAPAYDRAV